MYTETIHFFKTFFYRPQWHHMTWHSLQSRRVILAHKVNFSRRQRDLDIPPPPKERHPILQTCYITMQQAAYAGGSKNKNINNTDKYVPFISSHMHEHLYKCVGVTLVQMTGKTRALQNHCRKQLVVSVCMCVRERERKQEREFCRRECIRAKIQFATLEPALCGKPMRPSRKYCCSAVHKRASLTFDTDTVWCQWYTRATVT